MSSSIDTTDQRLSSPNQASLAERLSRLSEGIDTEHVSRMDKFDLMQKQLNPSKARFVPNPQDIDTMRKLLAIFESKAQEAELSGNFDEAERLRTLKAEREGQVLVFESRLQSPEAQLILGLQETIEFGRRSQEKYRRLAKDYLERAKTNVDVSAAMTTALVRLDQIQEALRPTTQAQSADGNSGGTTMIMATEVVDKLQELLRPSTQVQSADKDPGDMALEDDLIKRGLGNEVKQLFTGPLAAEGGAIVSVLADKLAAAASIPVSERNRHSTAPSSSDKLDREILAFSDTLSSLCIAGIILSVVLANSAPLDPEWANSILPTIFSLVLSFNLVNRKEFLEQTKNNSPNISRDRGTIVQNDDPSSVNSTGII